MKYYNIAVQLLTLHVFLNVRVLNLTVRLPDDK